MWRTQVQTCRRDKTGVPQANPASPHTTQTAQFIFGKRACVSWHQLALAEVRNPKIVVEWYEDIRDAVKHFGKRGA